MVEIEVVSPTVRKGGGGVADLEALHSELASVFDAVFPLELWGSGGPGQGLLPRWPGGAGRGGGSLGLLHAVAAT